MRRALALLLLAQCKTPPASVDAAAPPATSSPPALASTAAPSPTPTPTREAELPPPPSDAGAGACKVTSGPTKLARPGPYTAVSRMGFVDLYAQDHGAPALAGSVKIEAHGSAPAGSAPPVSAGDRSAVPACASAGTYVFCTNSAGEIRRYRFTSERAEPDNFVARARPGAPIAAALVSGHTLVAYLRDRTTSEGNTTEAYVESDDGSETRLSEDGAGATAVALAPRGNEAIAIYVDARRAMTPVHARTVTPSPKLALGKDAVLFVAGTAETYTRPAIAVRASARTAYALLPVAHDLAFGLATVKIEGEPTTDAPISWSDYPNGLDPAPLAATVDGSTVTVARVRPSAAKFGSPRVLELGAIDPSSSAFTAFGVVPTQGSPIDVAIASDGAGGVVIAYTDSGGGFAARLSCPK